VSGWTQIGTQTTGTLTSIVFEKVLAASDAGGTVSMSVSASTHATLSVAVYSGVSASSPLDAYASTGDTGQTSHISPSVSAHLGDWAVSYWADRSSATRTWTAPSAVTARNASVDSGSLTTQSLLGDSNGPVGAGSYGGLTATTDAAATSVSWTIALVSA
jgi:hypothetical protein